MNRVLLLSSISVICWSSFSVCQQSERLTEAVQDFSPLKIQITQFPVGICLKTLSVLQSCQEHLQKHTPQEMITAVDNNKLYLHDHTCTCGIAKATLREKTEKLRFHLITINLLY